MGRKRDWSERSISAAANKKDRRQFSDKKVRDDQVGTRNFWNFREGCSVI